jgi:hypothetical protein
LRHLPLRGADLVLMAMHGRWARSSNNTLLVLELDGPLDPGRLGRALGRLLDVCPWPAARLRRPFPWGKLRWAAPPRAALQQPPVRQQTADAPADVQRLLETELNASIDPRRDPPVRFLVVDGGAKPGAGLLVVTWFHPLMDPRGGQNLLVHLAALDPENGWTPWGERSPAFVAARDARPLRERGRLARQSLAYMRTLAPVPPVSPGTGLASPGPHRFRQASFVERHPTANHARARREISWRLALVGQAMAALWRRRRLPDVPFLLPIAVDLRPKGELGATFGNLLAFHFARFKPSDTTDVPALARVLRRQMADAVREGQIEANAVAMEFLHYRPLAMVRRTIPWAAGGETFSFNCADVTDFPPRLDHFLGRTVVNAYHVPAVLPRPGIGVFFNRCGARNNLVASWVEGAVSEDEVTIIVEAVREGMGWIRTS